MDDGSHAAAKQHHDYQRILSLNLEKWYKKLVLQGPRVVLSGTQQTADAMDDVMFSMAEKDTIDTILQARNEAPSPAQPRQRPEEDIRETPNRPRRTSMPAEGLDDSHLPPHSKAGGPRDPVEIVDLTSSPPVNGRPKGGSLTPSHLPPSLNFNSDNENDDTEQELAEIRTTNSMNAGPRRRRGIRRIVDDSQDGEEITMQPSGDLEVHEDSDVDAEGFSQARLDAANAPIDYDIDLDFPHSHHSNFATLSHDDKKIIARLGYSPRSHPKGKFGDPPIAELPCPFPGFEETWAGCVKKAKQDLADLEIMVDVPHACMKAMYTDPDIIWLCRKVLLDAAYLTGFRGVFDIAAIEKHFEGQGCISQSVFSDWDDHKHHKRSAGRVRTVGLDHRCSKCGKHHPILMLKWVFLVALDRLDADEWDKNTMHCSHRCHNGGKSSCGNPTHFVFETGEKNTSRSTECSKKPVGSTCTHSAQPKFQCLFDETPPTKESTREAYYEVCKAYMTRIACPYKTCKEADFWPKLSQHIASHHLGPVPAGVNGDLHASCPGCNDPFTIGGNGWTVTIKLHFAMKHFYGRCPVLDGGRRLLKDTRRPAWAVNLHEPLTITAYQAKSHGRKAFSTNLRRELYKLWVAVYGGTEYRTTWNHFSLSIMWQPEGFVEQAYGNGRLLVSDYTIYKDGNLPEDAWKHTKPSSRSRAGGRGYSGRNPRVEELDEEPVLEDIENEELDDSETGEQAVSRASRRARRSVRRNQQYQRDGFCVDDDD